MSVTTAAARGTFQPPAWSVATAREHRRRVRPGRVAQHPAGTDDQPDVRERPRRPHPARADGRAAARRRRRRPAPARGRDPTHRVDRQVAGSRTTRAAYALDALGQGHLLAAGGLDDPLGVPAHAEVGLDGPRVPQRRDDVLGQSGVLTLGPQRRVDVGRRPADVDDHDVAVQDARPAPATPSSTASGVGACTIAANSGPRDSPLPPMTCSRKTAPDRGARRLGCDDADRGQHVVGHRERPPGGSQQLRRPRPARLGVSGHDHGRGDAAPWRVGMRCAATLLRCRRRCRRPAGRGRGGFPAAPRTSAPDIGPDVDVGYPRTGAQPDPVAGLRGDVAFIAHHGQPQSTARAGTGEDLVDRTVRGELGTQRCDSRRGRRCRSSSGSSAVATTAPSRSTSTALVKVEPKSTHRAASLSASRPRSRSPALSRAGRGPAGGRR